MGDQVTNLTLSGGLFVLLLMALALTLGRRWVALPVLIAGTWLTLGQRLVVWDLNFTALRLVLLTVIIRMMLRGEWSRIPKSPLDTLFVLWNVFRIIAFTLLWLTTDAFINRVALALDAIGIYYCFRSTLRDLGDVAWLTKIMAYILVPVAILMTLERVTGYNAFSFFGGVAEYSAVRNGVVRSQGPYSHPILAGTVGAVWLSMFLGLWKGRRWRTAALAGVLSGLAMVITSGSSGPLLTVGCVLSAIGLWRLRKQMRLVRLGLVAGLILLQLFMNVPIWFIFSKINIVSGSTGWHRGHLIDMAIRHFWEWCVVGIKDVAVWGVFKGDITNHYLGEGTRGGFVTLSVFILIMARMFSSIGYAIRWEELLPRELRFLVWTLGAMIVGHAATFFSVAYSDSQSMLHWFVTVAMAVATVQAIDKARRESAVLDPPTVSPAQRESSIELKCDEVAS